jgi:hypothetical protein
MAPVFDQEADVTDAARAAMTAMFRNDAQLLFNADASEDHRRQFDNETSKSRVFLAQR